ncbi:hypothetical protein MBLNU13_g05202t2 [Cladosporium sp. NU13]
MATIGYGQAAVLPTPEITPDVVSLEARQDRRGPSSYLEASLVQDTANPKLPRLTRFAGGAAGAIEKATPIVLEIVQAISGRTKKMQEFTQDEVTLMAEQKPEYTSLCTNVGFDFVGTKIAQKTVTLDWGGGPLVTYECLYWQHGTYTHRGDGGFQNWAFIAHPGCTHSGGVVRCP